MKFIILKNTFLKPGEVDKLTLFDTTQTPKKECTGIQINESPWGGNRLKPITIFFKIIGLSGW